MHWNPGLMRRDRGARTISALLHVLGGTTPGLGIWPKVMYRRRKRITYKR
jgi:hypothetical protein